MAFVGNNENRRSQEYAERSFAESVLGRRLEIRIYAQHEDLARGTVMLTDGGGYQVFTAYLACAGKILAAGDIAEGQAVGMLIDRENGGVTVLLDAGDADTAAWTQSRIAETVDYWESANSPRIYCLREKSCGAVVFTEVDGERRFLVIRMNLGHCGLPKGHMEKYETEQETAMREVREETGVAITLIDGFRETVVYSLTPRTTKESVYFLGRFDGEDVTIQESEVSAYRLCPYEEARALITYENDRAVLDAAWIALTKADDKNDDQ